MSTYSNSPILVTGAAGQLGRAIITELKARGATDITAGSRDPAKVADLGVKTARVDFDDPSSLDAAFSGIERLMLISTDVLGVPGKRKEQHLAAVAAAKRAGVRHVVYTSMPSPEPGAQIPFAPDHLGTEEAIKESGMDYTILRHNWYFENTLMGMPQAIASGAVYTSAAQGGLAQVARDDLAAADAGALLTETGKHTYDLSGPQALTRDQEIAVFNRVLGTKINAVHLDDAALTGGLTAAGLPDFLIGLIVGADASIRTGRMGKVTDAVERLSGRKPRSLEDWLSANRELFAA